MKKQIIIPAIGSLLMLFFGGSLSAQGSLFDSGEIPEIKITFEKENWRYLLDSLRYNGDGLLTGTLETDGEKIEEAGVRYRSGVGFTPGNKRNGLYIKLPPDFSSEKLKGYTVLDLSSAVRDPSLVREVLAYEIIRSYVPAPKANFAKVFINEDYYGLFVNIEPLDQPFWDRYGMTGKGSLFLSNPEIIEQEPEGCTSRIYGSLGLDKGVTCLKNHFDASPGANWGALERLTETLNEDLSKIDQLLDVDKTLWMLAFNNVVANLNSYSGQYSPNYYLYLGEDGRFVPIVTELNLAFGSFKNTGSGSDLGIRQMIQLDPLLHSDNPSMPLVSRLLSNDLYKKQYLNHMSTIVNDHFKGESFKEKATTLQQEILSPLMEDVNKYYPTSDFLRSKEEIIGKKSRIPGLVDFMTKRASFLKMNPAFTIRPPAIADVEVKRRERFSSKRVSDFEIQAKIGKFTKKVHVYYRFADGDTFKMAEMKDNGNSSDEKANDSVYGVKITPPMGKKSIEYYIFAENAKAVNYSPTHYTKERYSASIQDLNK